MSPNHDPKFPTVLTPKLVPTEGDHPISTGVGAAGGALAGVALGSVVAGPLGAAVVGTIGAVTGAFAGNSAAEAVDQAEQDAYWQANYITRDYVERDRPYGDYQPAFRYGWESRARLINQEFKAAEAELARGWELAKGESKLAWSQAKHATSDAWHRLAGTEPKDKSCC